MSSDSLRNTLVEAKALIPFPFHFIVQVNYSDSEIYESYYCQMYLVRDEDTIAAVNGTHVESCDKKDERFEQRFFTVGASKVLGIQIVNVEGAVLHRLGVIYK